MTAAQYAKMKAKGKAVQSEDDMQDQVCAYLKMAYPKLMYRVDMAASKKTMGQAMRFKRQQKHRGWPDIELYEARGGFFGMLIESKKEDVMIYQANGQFATDHIREQAEVLAMLIDRGYNAKFAKGFWGVKSEIDEYMKLPPTIICDHDF